MRRKLLVAPLTLALIVAIVGGSTTAQFTARTDVPQNEFCAGTVLIEAAKTQGSKIIEDWEPGECREVSYDATNTGSKCIFLRARYDEEWYERWCETAMVRMNDSPADFTYQWANHPWFTYVISKPAQSRETFYLYAAQHHRVGEVDVWRDSSYLYIDIRLDPGFEMSESHVNVQLDAGSYQQPPGFGNWPYTADYDPPVDDHLYTIPWQSDWDNRELYIGVHADVCGDWMPWESADDVVSVEPCDPRWRKGNDGYLYYVGDNDCLEGVLAGETVGLCLRVCLAAEAANDYQHKMLRLLLTFEAVQCSNDAAHQLGWEFTCAAGAVTPTGGYFTAKAQANALLHTGVWSQQSKGLLVHTDYVALGESDHGPDTLLYGIDLENDGLPPITIDRVIVTWSSKQSNGRDAVGTDIGGNRTAQDLQRARRDGSSFYSFGANRTADTFEPARIIEVMISARDSEIVWSGREPSGTRLNISDHLLRSGQTAGMEMVFDSSMAGRELTIAFIMSDGSSKAVSMGPLAGSAVALGPDETVPAEEAETEAETEADTETADECETGEQDDCEGSCDECGGGEADSVEEDSAGDGSDSPGDEQQADGEDEASGDTDGDPGCAEPGADEEDAAGNGDEDGSAGHGDDAGAKEPDQTEDGNTGESDADPVDEEDSTSGDTEADAEEGAPGDDDANSAGEEPEGGQEQGATEEDEEDTSRPADTEATEDDCQS